MSERYTFETLGGFVAKASQYVASRYHKLIERDFIELREDVGQEIWCWVYGVGKSRIERWLASDPQQTTRIYRSMLDEGLKFAEKEKAERAGYSVADLFYYTPNTIEAVMPAVLDDTYMEPGGTIGDAITTVLDIRRVMTDDQREFFLENDSTHEDWLENVQILINKLGGDRPSRRYAVSNARAIAETGEAY